MTARIKKNSRKLTEDRYFSGDVLRDFFNNIDYIPLSRKQEISLIKKSKLSFYDEDKVTLEMKELFIEYYKEEFPKFKNKYENALTLEREKLLDEAIIDSGKWRDEFIKNNQRLVLSIAKKYLFKCHHLDLIDLVQEGNFGLMSALMKFDITQGYKFSTYAEHWIKQSISKAIVDQDNTIRTPAYFYDMIVKVRNVEKELHNKLERIPSMEEIATETGIPLKTVLQVYNFIQNKFIPVSLEVPITDDTDDELGDLISSDEVDISKQVITQIVNEELKQIIDDSNLCDIYKEILYLYFGLKDGNPYSFKDIAKKYYVPEKQIKSICQKSIITLRDNETLKDYFNEQLGGYVKKRI